MTVSTKRTPNRGWLAVDLPNLRANARAVQAAARGTPLLPVIKADAYGLGADRVMRALDDLDPWGFAVATVEEGIEILTGIAAGEPDESGNFSEGTVYHKVQEKLKHYLKRSHILKNEFDDE